MYKKILDFLTKNAQKSFSINEIKSKLNLKKDYSSVFRVIQKLTKDDLVEKEGQGRSTLYHFKTDDLDQYFSIPFFERKKVSYNPYFLENYNPNQSSFLNQSELKILEKCNEGVVLTTDFLLNNHRLYENLLIDLAYSSSFLEGNTYSYLDTEVLLKYGDESQGKSKEETRMLLNHKKAIEYIVKNKNLIQINLKSIKEVHSLLGKDLLADKYLGVFRNTNVAIGGSAYSPLDNLYLLEDAFDLFLKKLNQIKNPFEQCFFILVFIPYFQAFQDINKRTARIFCNLPLLKNNLIPFSFLMVDKKEYIKGILGVYELNDISRLKEVFLNSYTKTYNRYFQGE